jgi:hypothetical protein
MKRADMTPSMAPVSLTNGEVTVSAATGYGPRVTAYGFQGERNVLGVLSPEESVAATPFGEPWHSYGGHRLWYAPEDAVGSYFPDNAPVSVEHDGLRLVLTQLPERHTGLEKQIEVRLDPHGTGVRLTHRLRHRGTRTLRLAPWALTVMAPRGEGFFSQPTFSPHPRSLAPARPMVLWPFTRMDDPRWRWGSRLVRLRQDPSVLTDAYEAQKLGLFNEHGWLGYAVDGLVFIKTFPVMSGEHADLGCNAQLFTNRLVLELESLGPLVTLEPGEVVEHREHWSLARASLSDDEDTRAMEVEALLRRLGSTTS